MPLFTQNLKNGSTFPPPPPGGGGGGDANYGCVQGYSNLLWNVSEAPGMSYIRYSPASRLQSHSKEISSQ